jgi:hypothetical protein
MAWCGNVCGESVCRLDGAMHGFGWHVDQELLGALEETGLSGRKNELIPSVECVKPYPSQRNSPLNSLRLATSAVLESRRISYLAAPPGA